jgi:hypothetical protein
MPGVQQSLETKQWAIAGGEHADAAERSLRHSQSGLFRSREGGDGAVPAGAPPQPADVTAAERALGIERRPASGARAVHR